jgi:pyrroloquinoline quinone (PQQ) biosynthesis protein C
MPREWMNFVEGELETPFGPMGFAITQGDHVHISTDQSENVVVNRVPYSISLHLHRQPDGTWTRKDSRDPYMSKAGTMHEYTFSAQEKAYQGIRQAWEEFIARHQDALLEAERGHLNNEIMRADEEVEKAQKTLAEEERKRSELLAREKALWETLSGRIKRGGYPTPTDWSPRGKIPEPEE